METPPIDLGHGVVITFWTEDRHGNVIGLVEEHPADNTPSGRCEGGVLFDTPEAHAQCEGSSIPGAFWQVKSWEPLTLSPSLLCRACGHHGFIKGGRWIPA